MTYVPNLPDDVQEKIKLLSKYQSQIASLETQLQETRVKHDRLQSELLQYRNDASPSAKSIAAATVDITKLPNEMLLNVFEHFLSENHRRIRTLLTVCKRWHSMVMQSPRIWARVQLWACPYTGYQSSKPSAMVYIEACLQHSQSLLLDVEIDYGALPDRDEFIRDWTESALRDIVDEDDHPAIGTWLDNSYSSYCDLASGKFDAYYIDVFGELGTLVGPDGTNMERWYSLDIHFPSWNGYYAAHRIWESLGGPTPNLAFASFTHLGVVNDILAGEGARGQVLDVAFPVLSGLRSLTFDDSPVNLFLKFKVSPPSLHHLDIYYHDLIVIQGLPKFSLLRKLSLTTTLSEDAQPGDSDRRKTRSLFVVRLPHLEELVLVGNPHILRHAEFDFPCLHKLLLFTATGLYLHPSLSPAHIYWSVPTPLYGHWTKETITAAVLRLLQSSNRIEDVTIPEFARSYVPQAVSELRETSSLPASLGRVMVELADGRREPIDVSCS